MMLLLPVAADNDFILCYICAMARATPRAAHSCQHRGADAFTSIDLD
jgi:hypothetical protein